MSDIDGGQVAAGVGTGAATGGWVGAAIGGAAAVGSQLLANRNKPKPVMPSVNVGQAAQLKPSMTAFEPLLNRQGPNPTFGQFLGE